MTARFEDRLSILRQLAPGHGNQPATALWRSYELQALFAHASLQGRVLDLGCGDGTLGGVVFSRMPAVTERIGLEPDEADAALARLSQTYQRVVCAPGNATGLDPGSLDGVLANSVLEHIPDLPPVLAESARVLKSGGLFVATVPGHDFHRCLRGGLVARIASWQTGETQARYLDRRLAHWHYHSVDEWRELLAAAGLSLKAALPYFPQYAVQAWEQLSDLSGGLVYALGGSRIHPRQLQRNLGLLKDRPAAAPLPLQWACIAVCAPFLNFEAGPLFGGTLILAEKA